jgi:hypothetical protein
MSKITVKKRSKLPSAAHRPVEGLAGGPRSWLPAAASLQYCDPAQKVRLAKDAWDTSDLALVALYTTDSRWRNR